MVGYQVLRRQHHHFRQDHLFGQMDDGQGG